MKAAIFDLDGTLIDSAPAIAGIGDRLCAELGLAALSVEEARGYVGHGAEAFLRRVLDARGAAFTPERLTRFKDIYAADDARRNAPYPGVEAALDALAARGLALGICTNKPTAPTLRVLDRLGWRDRFAAVVAGDTLPLRKPDPAPLHHCARALGADIAEILYIGDSEVDAQTAAALDVPFLIYTHGYRATPLEAIPHRAAFDHFDALPCLAARFGASAA